MAPTHELEVDGGIYKATSVLSCKCSTYVRVYSTKPGISSASFLKPFNSYVCADYTKQIPPSS